MNDMILKLQQIEQNILNSKLKYIKKDITSSLDKIYTLQIEKAQYFLKLFYTKYNITINLNKLKSTNKTIEILKLKTEINSKFKYMNILITNKLKIIIDYKINRFNKFIYYRRDKIYTYIKNKMIYTEKRDKIIKKSNILFSKWIHSIITHIEIFLNLLNSNNFGITSDKKFYYKKENESIKKLNDEFSSKEKTQLISNNFDTSAHKFKSTDVYTNLFKNDKFNNIEISTDSIYNLHSFNSTETNSNGHYFNSSEIKNLRKESDFTESNHEFFSTTTNNLNIQFLSSFLVNKENLYNHNEINYEKNNSQNADNFFISMQRESKKYDHRFNCKNITVVNHKFNNVKNTPKKFSNAHIETNLHEIHRSLTNVDIKDNQNDNMSYKQEQIPNNTNHVFKNKKKSFINHDFNSVISEKKYNFFTTEFSTERSHKKNGMNEIFNNKRKNVPLKLNKHTNNSLINSHMYNYSDTQQYKIKHTNVNTRVHLNIYQSLFKFGQYLIKKLNETYKIETKNIHLDNVKLHILLTLIKLRCNFLKHNTKNIQDVNYDRIYFILSEGNIDSDKRFFEMIDETIHEIDKFKDPVIIRMGIQFILAKKYVKDIINLKESIKL